MTRMASKSQRSVGFREAPSIEGDQAAPWPAVAHGIVLAGVHSWGDCLLDEVICRPAIPIAGEPLVCHALRWLHDYGIRTASLCANSDTGYLRRCLQDGNELGLALEYYEDVMPRGPAGSLRDAALVSPAELFVVIYGTVVPRLDLVTLLAAHRTADACVTVVATRSGTRRRATEGDLEPAGIYVFSREALKLVPAKGYQDIKETLLPHLYAQGKRVITHVVGHCAAGRVLDTPSYISVCRWAVTRMSRESGMDSQYLRRDEAWIHETAHVSPTAQLIGPMIIEPDCVVGAEALIVGPTTVGAGSTLGPRTVVSRSIIWSGCQIGSNAILDDCVLTDGTRIDAGTVVRGTVCANLGNGRPGLPAVATSRISAGKPAQASVLTHSNAGRRPYPVWNAGPLTTFSPATTHAAPLHGPGAAQHSLEGAGEHHG
ncbi:MAG: NDP-sugar synthase [Planctomycetes bacterium]|nr:NDP-sugar synthase [Planctomycetota bacterium]